MSNFIFYLIFLLVFNFGVQGQNYLPILGDTTNVWHVFHSGICDGYSNSQLIETSIKQVFNGNEYTFIQMLNNQSTLDHGHYLREDLEQKQLFRFDQSKNRELIVADFNLEIGDMFSFYDPFSEAFFNDVVIAIEFVNHRKYIIFGSGNASCLHGAYDNKKFIEGVGTNLLFDNANFLLLCKHKNNTIEYYANFKKVYRTDSCSILLLNEEELANSLLGFEVYPNPANAFLNIEVNEEETDAILSIFDIQGKEIFRIDQVQISNRIDVSNFPCGSYYCELRGTKRLTVKKLIIY